MFNMLLKRIVFIIIIIDYKMKISINFPIVYVKIGFALS
jgi:hypothetical protein